MLLILDMLDFAQIDFVHVDCIDYVANLCQDVVKEFARCISVHKTYIHKLLYNN